MSDLMKKIGMNSQTLRVVMKSPTEKITKDGIVDFHITDGSTGTHFMGLMASSNPTAYMTQNLTAYEVESVALETDPMSWGTPNDKMTDINFTDINAPKPQGIQPNPHMLTPSKPKIVMMSNPTSSGYTAYPVQYSLRPKPSTQRSDFSNTDENAKNFGNLFGN